MLIWFDDSNMCYMLWNDSQKSDVYDMWFDALMTGIQVFAAMVRYAWFGELVSGLMTLAMQLTYIYVSLKLPVSL